MIRALLIIGTFLFTPFVSSAQDIDALREKYLSDPQTSEGVKEAIRQRIVVVGMCPFEAFAAAGAPGPYFVKRDTAKWVAHTPPPNIISAQCAAPDESIIELMFKNSSQFKTSEPAVFRVRFIHGRAVLIDQKGFRDE
jgi:hypothetical protein